MDIGQIEIFRDIAYLRNFSAVANKHFLTQPAVSSRLKALEEELGVVLFERAPRNVALTSEGRLLLPIAEELLMKYSELKDMAVSSRKEAIGELKIATIHSIGLYELAPGIKRFLKNYPQIRLHMQYRTANDIYKLVEKREIDLGMVAYPESRENIKSTECGRDNLVLVAPPSHPLTRKKRVSIKDLSGINFITFERDTPTRLAIDKALKKNGVSVDIRMTDDNINTLKHGVEVGLGVSILPDTSVREEIKAGTLKMIKLSNFSESRPLGIISRADHRASYPEKLFLDSLHCGKGGIPEHSCL